MLLNQIKTTIIKNSLIREQKRFYKTLYNPSPKLNLTLKVEPVVEPPQGVNFYVYNRNPRNLERLLIAHQHKGWDLEKLGRSFYHKLRIKQSRGVISVSAIHFNDNKIVVSASSDEWCIRKHLYRGNDLTAWVNIGRIFARRCLECGISEMLSTYDPVSNGKMDRLLKEIENGGISLTEGEQIIHFIDKKTKVKREMLYDVEENE